MLFRRKLKETSRKKRIVLENIAKSKRLAKTAFNQRVQSPPGKAVRKALGEISYYFSGDIEKAAEWLQKAYNRPVPDEKT